MSAWDFFQDQILGMHWINDLVGSLLTFLGVDITTRIGGSIQFFIYDCTKIMILLVVLIYIISYIQSYFPPERTKQILGNIKGIWANFVGAILGTLTPFCSCSSIPIFIGFTKAGLPLGVTFSFLISSPLVDMGALVILMGIFGFNVAVAYVVVGILLAVVGGFIIQRLGMEDQIEEFARPEVCSCEGGSCSADGKYVPAEDIDRRNYAWTQVKFTLKKVFPYLLLGVFIGALIHNWIPTDVIQAILGQENPFSVIIATLLGAPVYADIFGTIPIAEALLDKGVEVGTILAFMMSVTTLSIPSLVLLKTVVKKKLLGIFILIVLIGIIVIGYLFNFLMML